jgi:hypothetical protein
VVAEPEVPSTLIPKTTTGHEPEPVLSIWISLEPWVWIRRTPVEIRTGYVPNIRQLPLSQLAWPLPHVIHYHCYRESAVTLRQSDASLGRLSLHEIILHLRWWHQVASKRQYLHTKLYGVNSQKISYILRMEAVNSFETLVTTEVMNFMFDSRWTRQWLW